MELKISENASKNYLAKIVRLGSLKKHPKADRLQIATIDFQNVITGMDAKEGDIYVYFPLECAINKDFLAYTNSFSNSAQNKDDTVKGFFDKNGRVRAVKLRGEPSQGYIIPLTVLEEWLQSVDISSKPNGITSYLGEDDWSVLDGVEFNYFGDIEICRKYIPKRTEGSGNKSKQKSRTPRISRLVENQFRFHNDTDQLRKNIHRLEPDDYIGIHYKKHGTSFVVGNLLTKVNLKWWQKALIKLGLKLGDVIYDYVYSSRKVVKNEYETQNSNHYFGYDLWADIKESIKDKIPKGYTLYGEAIGRTKDCGYIQKDYDYGCKETEYKIYIYRITITNIDGFVIELDDRQIQQFCDKYDLLYSDTFKYYGKAKNWFDHQVNDYILSEHPEEWRAEFIKALEKEYNEKDCYMCVNKVPCEGIVLRKQSLFEYEAYKLKSFRFLEKETKDLDAGIIDIETKESTNEHNDNEGGA